MRPIGLSSLKRRVALMDCFNVLVRKGLVENAMSNASPEDIEKIFDVLFGLVELPPFASQSSAEPIPYLNRPLIADYQDAYDFSKVVTSALLKARSEDARIVLLESQLHAISPSFEEQGERQKRPGALKLLLRSSGVPLVGIDLKGKGKARPILSAVVSGSQASSSAPDDLDIKITQVLDILPDQPAEYIRSLLEHPNYPFKGNPERVIEALLEGTAPTQEDSIKSSANRKVATGDHGTEEEFVYTQGRKNVFDDEVMDLDNVRVGKKRSVNFLCTYVWGLTLICLCEARMRPPCYWIGLLWNT
jgi:activating signal cointegrator complex subunit 2